MDTTPLFRKNYNSSAQVIINQGGTSSGKTYAILQTLFILAASETLVITVVGQDIPNLKAGALRDAMAIYKESAALTSIITKFNKTDRIYEFGNGSIIEFKSYSDAQDAKSGKRDYLFLNEANGISRDIYAELSLRTRKQVFIDYNPNNEFWAHDLIGKPGVELLISDHRHNPWVDVNVRNRVEGLKNEDYELWKVYARGLTGKIKGLVFSNWFICEAIPTEAKLIAAGLDFGFTNDETGCLLVYKQTGELWVEELFYETGLTNIDITKKLSSAGVSKNTEIIADSAEPKSIEDFRRLGWYITGAKKGADSISHSIDILKRYRINVTRASVNLRNELSRYKWRTDRSGKATNQPIDACNHLIDPLRYVALNKLKTATAKSLKSKLPALHSSLTGGELPEFLMGMA